MADANESKLAASQPSHQNVIQIQKSLFVKSMSTIVHHVHDCEHYSFLMHVVHNYSYIRHFLQCYSIGAYNSAEFLKF